MTITATDRNERVLTRAQYGSFPEGSVRDLAGDLIDRGFDKTGSEYVIKNEFRKQVQFFRQDIREEMPKEQFDIIFCRNLVFTYFDPALQDSVMKKLLSKLRPAGYFVIGSNERLPANSERLIQVKKGEPIYRYQTPESGM